MNELNITIPDNITYKYTDKEHITHEFIISLYANQISNVSINNKNKKYISFMYKITYKKQKLNEQLNSYTCYIPYYLSDGTTNHFRLNLLFPYICIVNQQSSITCPRLLNSSPYNSGLLLKYAGIHNFDIKKIHNDIIIKDINNMREAINDADYYYIDPIENESKQNDAGKINSVLPRLSNILDFIIAISSYYIPAIYDIHDVIKTYPNYNDTFDKFNIDTDAHDDNQEYFDKKMKNTDVTKFYDSEYRVSLLNFLVIAKQKCINTNFINVTYKTIIFTEKNIINNIQLINTFMKNENIKNENIKNEICDNNLVSHNAHKNYDIYNYISYHLSKSLNLDENFFYKTYMINHTQKFPVLTNLIEKWHATCNVNDSNIKSYI